MTDLVRTNVPTLRHGSKPGAEDRRDQDRRRRCMKHTWYVTFEVPPDGTLLKTATTAPDQDFRHQAEVRDFARAKFVEGSNVTAGTIIPHQPRASIPSTEIPAWLEPSGQVDPNQ